MRTLFIVNPHSRGGKTQAFGEELVPWVHQNFPSGSLSFTERPGHAIEIAEHAVSQGYEAIISVGGDGTLNEIVNGICAVKKEHRPCLGILSQGTGGDFARGLKERFRFSKDPTWLLNAKKHEIDCGRAIFYEKSGEETLRYFINIADVGLAGEVTRRVNQGKKRLGSLEYVRATLQAALSYQAPKVSIQEWNGLQSSTPVEMDLLLFILANGRYFGGGMCIAPEAKIDDGFFQVLSAPKISYWALLAQLPRLYLKKRFSLSKVQYGQSKRVRVESLEGVLPLDIDGEYFEAHQVEFEIIPEGLTMLVPAPYGAGRRPSP